MESLQIKLSFEDGHWVAFTDRVDAAFQAESPQAAVGGLILQHGGRMGIDLVMPDYGNGVAAIMIELEKTRKQLKVAQEELHTFRSRSF